MNLYRDTIIELNKNPLNKRKIANANFTASGANVTCGDRLRIYLKTDKKGKITDASFEGYGCAISIASASLLTEEIKGKTLKEIAKWNLTKVNELLGVELGPSRAKCGLLALETIKQSTSSR
jgi:nitrogen fixation NifU-like protein